MQSGLSFKNTMLSPLLYGGLYADTLYRPNVQRDLS
jgi:hypothetical protein